MKKIYAIYCKVEDIVVGLGFAAIVILTFMNAVLRYCGTPIIYADDLCLLLFSWTAFLGADVAMRYSRLVGMDILVSKLPPKVQKVLQIIVFILMILMLFVLIRGGFGRSSPKTNDTNELFQSPFGFYVGTELMLDILQAHEGP